MRNSTAIAVSIGAAGAGAALMFFLDPNRGRRRRRIIGDKTGSAAQQTSRFFVKAGRDLRNRSWGVFAGTRLRVTMEPVPDSVLTERIRAKMGRTVSHPSAIEVSVRDGIVTLRGDILRSEIRELMACIYRQHGVVDVENQLQAHDSAGNVPGLQGPGRTSAEPWILRSSRTPGGRLFMAAAGGALALYGARNYGTLGKTMSAAGAGLLSGGIVSKGLSELARMAS